jgi:hypothetical protein
MRARTRPLWRVFGSQIYGHIAVCASGDSAPVTQFSALRREVCTRFTLRGSHGASRIFPASAVYRGPSGFELYGPAHRRVGDERGSDAAVLGHRELDGAPGLFDRRSRRRDAEAQMG